MKVIIWGTGNYCRLKINYIDDEIVAVADREKKDFLGFKTITLEDIQYYIYDKIYVLSTYYIDIIKDLLNVGIDEDKIIPGICIKPYLSSELNYINHSIKVKVRKDGGISFVNRDGREIVIRQYSDIKYLKDYICDEENAKILKQLSTRPVDKVYGVERGGSIVRYYISDFLEKYKTLIKGNVLEIGGRDYTRKFGDKNCQSYSLFFEHGIENSGKDEFDIYGDLSTGDGLEKGFYDCIVLTQVLNFVKDIDNVSQNLIDSLKVGGVVILTVAGITPICRYDMDTYGQYWSFTDKSIFNMFSRKNTEVSIVTYGNLKTTCAFLAGMAYTELDDDDLIYNDSDFQ